MLDDPRVNFAISTRGRQPGLDHLGIQVENKEELHEVYARLREAGGTIIEQGADQPAATPSRKSRGSTIPPASRGKRSSPRARAPITATAPASATRAWHTPRRAAYRQAPCSGALRPAAPVRRAVTDRPFNVLFLCTGNSARSIMAEAILNKLGAGKFHAYSAGSQPKGKVNPHTIQLLQGLDYDTSGFRSKSWNEFAKPGAPPLDFVFTVCDNAAGEACPVWPGQPMTAHWGIPDPAEAKGTPAEIALAFKDTYRMLYQRIGIFTALPLRSLDQLSLQNKLREIGRMRGATAKAAEPT